VAGKSLEPGAHLAAVFSERAAPLDPAQARRFLDVLLRLYELGSLTFEDAPVAVHRSPAQGPAGGCGQVRAERVASGLPLTNRQPSNYTEAGER